MADPVLVFGDDTRSFLAVARSLGRHGVEVHAAASDVDHPALRSRYISQIHLLPAYHHSPTAWQEATSGLVRSHRFSLLIPTSDSSLAKLATHASAFSPALVASPGTSALASFSDKAATRALAARLGIPVPPGEIIEPSSPPDALAERLQIPLVLKPCRSYQLSDIVEKRRAVIVRSKEQLTAEWRATAQGQWLAEGFIPGVGVGLSVMARHGQVIHAFQHRRLAEAWETGPSSSRISEQTDPQLRLWVEKLCAATSLHGVAMFEFRRVQSTREHVLLEVNPRFWGSLPLAIAAGSDFPAMLYDMLMGRDSPVPSASPRRVVRRDLTGEYYRIVRIFEKRRWIKGVGAAAAMVASLLAAPTWDSWAKDDTEPFRQEQMILLDRLKRAISGRLKTGFETRAPETPI